MLQDIRQSVPHASLSCPSITCIIKALITVQLLTVYCALDRSRGQVRPAFEARPGTLIEEDTMPLFVMRCQWAVLALCFVVGAHAKPEQIHLSVTSKLDEVIVWWITDDEPATSTVMWGRSKWNLNETATSKSVERYRYKGLRMRSGYTSGYIHEVIIQDLPVNDSSATLYYKCGDERNGWSDVRSFRTRPGHPDAPVTIAANGDQVMLCVQSQSWTCGTVYLCR